MKAISVRQPWTWAILHAGKCIENRNWRTHLRGRILLHASKGCERGEYVEAACSITGVLANFGIEPEFQVPPLDELPRGALVGAATIVDCVPYHKSPWFCGPWGIVLAEVVALPRPVPCQGALGLWRVPESVMNEVRILVEGVSL
jgi:hypothetical protein